MAQVRPLYDKFAVYYDLLHSKKNYKKEVSKLHQIIKSYNISDGANLLDVACGTGRHISYFQKYYACTGIDYHKSMLKVARKNNIDIIFKQGEMENFQLRKKFDIITCLYGGISYSLTEKKLKKTILNFINHLNHGGLILIEPYFTEKQFKPNRPVLSTIESENIKIARVSISKRKQNLASRKMIMTIADADKGLFSFEDTRDIALFSSKQIIKSMKLAGLKTNHIKNGITSDFNLYIGLKT